MNLRRLKKTCLAVLATLAAATTAPTAHAQFQERDVSADIRTSTTRLSDPQRNQVREYVQPRLEALESGDVAAMQRARNDLLRQLSQADAGVPFRLAMSESLASGLSRLSASEDVLRAMNALYISGEVATARTAEIAADALDRDDPALRYAAAYALGLSFQAVERSTPAIGPDEALDLIRRRLAPRLEAEGEAYVMDRLVRTISSAAQISRPGYEQVRLQSLTELSSGLGRRLQSLDPEKNNVATLQMILRAVETVQTAFTQGALSRLRAEPTAAQRAAIVAAAGMGGDAMTYVARRIRAGVDKPEERDLLGMISRSAENVVFFARGALQPGAAQDMGISDRLLNEGDADGYLRELQRLLGPDGVLPRPPFELPAERFAY